MKKLAIIAAVIVFLLAVPMSVSVNGVTPSSGFADVDQSFWAYTAIDNLAQMGIINGYPDGTFKPENPVTRAEFAKMVGIAFRLPAPGVSGGFTDITGHWASGYIDAASERGFIKGYPDGTFKPENSVTKAEILTILIRALGLEKVQFKDIWIFQDVPRAHWAYSYVCIALEHNLIDLSEGSAVVRLIADEQQPNYYHFFLDPDKPATRAQTAWFLYQALLK